MTTKILDNTVISASIKEITCLNFIERCSQIYHIVTSFEVFHEANIGFDKGTTNKQFRCIRVIDLRHTEQYRSLLDYLKNRYPYLHDGEISSFLLALLEYENKNKEYYYVTDDQSMKKVVTNLKNDNLFYQNSGLMISRFFITGTIGLLRRLLDKGAISKKEIEDIIKDLRNSSFYVTKDLIDYLRG